MRQFLPLGLLDDLGLLERRNGIESNLLIGKNQSANDRYRPKPVINHNDPPSVITIDSCCDMGDI